MQRTEIGTRRRCRSSDKKDGTFRVIRKFGVKCLENSFESHGTVRGGKRSKTLPDNV